MPYKLKSRSLTLIAILAIDRLVLSQNDAIVSRDSCADIIRFIDLSFKLLEGYRLRNLVSLSALG